jgi:hypothetical protein
VVGGRVVTKVHDIGRPPTARRRWPPREGRSHARRHSPSSPPLLVADCGNLVAVTCLVGGCELTTAIRGINSFREALCGGPS